MSLGELAKASAHAFPRYMSYLQLGLVALLAPVFTAGAITQEKDSQTYDILLSTPLTNGADRARLAAVAAVLRRRAARSAASRFSPSRRSSAAWRSPASCYSFRHRRRHRVCHRRWRWRSRPSRSAPAGRSSASTCSSSIYCRRPVLLDPAGLLPRPTSDPRRQRSCDPTPAGSPASIRSWRCGSIFHQKELPAAGSC